MDHVILSKKVFLSEEVDVVVVGGGIAGIAAAISAARLGVKTALVERYGFLGGMATAGLVGPFMTSYDSRGEVQIIRGLFEELVRKMESLGGAIHSSQVRAGSLYAGFITVGHDHVTPFDPECLKVVADEMVKDAGVQLFLHTYFLEAVREERLVGPIVLVDKAGLKALRGKIVIDCTGDADVCRSLGLPLVYGDGTTAQPATTFFRICNVDSEKVRAYVREYIKNIGQPFSGPFSWLVSKAKEEGEWIIPRDEIGMYETPVPGVWRINTTRILRVDGTKAEDLTRAEIEGRRQARFVFEFIKKHIPGFEKAIFMDTATQIGIRETWHVKGEYVLTVDDLLNGVSFDDTIALGAYPVDIHSSSNGGGEFIPLRGTRWYHIPYRSLLPKEVENLLVAGRPISATHEAAAAIRVMPIAMATGEAAGTAAALAIRQSKSLRELSSKDLQEQLKRQGVFLGEEC